jgi:hypothetical protein
VGDGKCYGPTVVLHYFLSHQMEMTSCDLTSVIFAEHSEGVVVSEKSLLVIMFKPSIPEYFRKVV